MAAADLSYGDYVKAAFTRKVPLRGLGPMPVNQMALGVFAVLGMANPGFWLLGAAVELAYLFSLSSSERFQKVVQGERLLARHAGWEVKVQESLARLSPPSRERYRAILDKCRHILGISKTLDADSLGNLRDVQGRSLNQLLGIFLRLLTSREVIHDNVEGLDRKSLEGDIAGLERRLESLAEGSEGALRRSLEGTLEIRRRRLENLDRARSSLRVIDAELERIEQQVELLREESAVSGKPEVLSARLDAVTTAMSETSRWMDRHADLLGAYSSEEPGSSLGELPSLPQIEKAVENE